MKPSQYAEGFQCAASLASCHAITASRRRARRPRPLLFEWEFQEPRRLGLGGRSGTRRSRPCWPGRAWRGRALSRVRDGRGRNGACTLQALGPALLGIEHVPDIGDLGLAILRRGRQVAADPVAGVGAGADEVDLAVGGRTGEFVDEGGADRERALRRCSPGRPERPRAIRRAGPGRPRGPPRASRRQAARTCFIPAMEDPVLVLRQRSLKLNGARRPDQPRWRMPIGQDVEAEGEEACDQAPEGGADAEERTGRRP